LSEITSKGLKNVQKASSTANNYLFVLELSKLTFKAFIVSLNCQVTS